MQQPRNPLRILECLVEHEVEFVVIGGVAGVLHGSPLVTWDLDLVHARTPENVARICAALATLNAHYRTHPDRRPAPDPVLLLGPGHHLMATSAGRLDLLGAVTGDRDYWALLP